MNRRKFIGNVSLGVAGISVANACSGGSKGTVTENINQQNLQVPGYRAKIKSSFTIANSKSAGDKVILALIGAGNWGTVLIQNIIELNKNIEIKYVCDVDDTRGGKVIAEVEKKQGYSF